PSPRRPPLSPVPPAASSRLSLLAGASSGRAVASSSIAAASPSPACPPFPAETPGAAFPPSPFPFLRVGRLQPPLSPCLSAGRRRHHLPRLRDATLIPGITSSSPEFRRNTVARAGFSFLLGGISSGCPFRHARASAGAAVPSLGTVT
ncbi:Os06g0561501, partial [Oryza sativa Japonica Group]